MVNFEFARAPVDTSIYLRSNCESPSERLSKLGVAVVLLDKKDRMLLIEHEGRDLNFRQGMLGPPSETFAFVPDRGPGMSETPLEAGVRCLLEELPATPEELIASGLYVAKDSFLESGRWDLGEIDGVIEYVLGMTLQIRVEDPKPLLNGNRSNEGVGKRFVPIDKVLDFNEDEFRPGFLQWFGDVQKVWDRVPRDSTNLMWVDEMDRLPLIAQDVRF